MSGHSKWSKIQHKKGKADKARSNLFTKLLRAITITAQQGGGDPEMNFSLRLAVDRAKAGNVPKDNIERAIKKGTGELKDGTIIEEAMYEGFGPGGVAVLVETMTDNKNRTVSEVKHALSRYGGSLGGPGSVQWQFERKGVVIIDTAKLQEVGIEKDQFELSLMDAGVEDISEEEGLISVISSISDFQKVLEAIQGMNIEASDSGLKWIAKDTMEISDEVMTKVESLYEALDELDDVREVYMNI